jgi:hypothetical protein
MEHGNPLMLCAKPITAVLASGLQMVGCGQCINCTINKRRAWTARIMLEGLAAEKNHRQVSWTTLTYAEEALPLAARGRGHEPSPTLRPGDYVLAFKRMRKPDVLGPFRFVLCGEYGDKFGRPHYHALIFGPDSHDVEAALQRYWEPDFGHTRTRPWRAGEDIEANGTEVALGRAAYVANYVTKKMNTQDAPKLGMVRDPEFFRCSRNPAIGWSQHLLDLCTTNGGSIEMAETGDVPRSIRINKKQYPLARVLREHLRDDLGIPQTVLERNQIITPLRERYQPTAEDYHRAAQTHAKIKRQRAISANKANF